MREEGTVVESYGDRAKIRVERSSACRHCSARALCRPFGETSNVMTVGNPPGASVGQRVVVAIEPVRLVKSSLMVYGIPVAAFIIGAAVGGHIGRVRAGDVGTDIGAIVGAAMLLALALMGVRVLDRTAARDVEGLPQIVEILDT